MTFSILFLFLFRECFLILTPSQKNEIDEFGKELYMVGGTVLDEVGNIAGDVADHIDFEDGTYSDTRAYVIRDVSKCYLNGLECEVKFGMDYYRSEGESDAEVALNVCAEVDPTGVCDIAKKVKNVWKEALSTGDNMEKCESFGGIFSYSEVDTFCQSGFDLIDTFKGIANCYGCAVRECPQGFMTSGYGKCNGEDEELIQNGMSNGLPCRMCVNSMTVCGEYGWILESIFSGCYEHEIEQCEVRTPQTIHSGTIGTRSCCRCYDGCGHEYGSTPEYDMDEKKDECMESNLDVEIGEDSWVDEFNDNQQIYCTRCQDPCSPGFKFGLEMRSCGEDEVYDCQSDNSMCCKCFTKCENAMGILGFRHPYSSPMKWFDSEFYAWEYVRYNNVGYFPICFDDDIALGAKCCVFYEDRCPTLFGDTYSYQNSLAYYGVGEEIPFKTMVFGYEDITRPNGEVNWEYGKYALDKKCVHWNNHSEETFYEQRLGYTDNKKKIPCCTVGVNCENDQFFDWGVSLKTCEDVNDYSGWNLIKEITEYDSSSDAWLPFRGYGLGCGRCDRKKFCPNDVALSRGITETPSMFEMPKIAYLPDPLHQPLEKEVKYFTYDYWFDFVEKTGEPENHASHRKCPNEGEVPHCLRHPNGFAKLSGEEMCCRCDRRDCPCDNTRECEVYETPTFEGFRFIKEVDGSEYETCECCEVDMRPCPGYSTTDEDLTCSTDVPWYYVLTNYKGRYHNKLSCNHCSLSCPPGYTELWTGSKDLFGKLPWEVSGECSEYKFIGPGLISENWCCKQPIKDQNMNQDFSPVYDGFENFENFFGGKRTIWELALDCVEECLFTDTDTNQYDCSMHCKDENMDLYVTYCMDNIFQYMSEEMCREKGLRDLFEMTACFDFDTSSLQKDCEKKVSISGYIENTISFNLLSRCVASCVLESSDLCVEHCVATETPPICSSVCIEEFGGDEASKCSSLCSELLPLLADDDVGRYGRTLHSFYDEPGDILWEAKDDTDLLVSIEYTFLCMKNGYDNVEDCASYRDPLTIKQFRQTPGDAMFIEYEETILNQVFYEGNLIPEVVIDKCIKEGRPRYDLIDDFKIETGCLVCKEDYDAWMIENPPPTVDDDDWMIDDGMGMGGPDDGTGMGGPMMDDGTGMGGPGDGTAGPIGGMVDRLKCSEMTEEEELDYLFEKCEKTPVYVYLREECYEEAKYIVSRLTQNVHQLWNTEISKAILGKKVEYGNRMLNCEDPLNCEEGILIDLTDFFRTEFFSWVDPSSINYFGDDDLDEFLLIYEKLFIESIVQRNQFGYDLCWLNDYGGKFIFPGLEFSMVDSIEYTRKCLYGESEKKEPRNILAATECVYEGIEYCSETEGKEHFEDFVAKYWEGDEMFLVKTYLDGDLPTFISSSCAKEIFFTFEKDNNARFDSTICSGDADQYWVPRSESIMNGGSMSDRTVYVTPLACSSCVPHTYTKYIGQSNCENCPSGTYRDVGMLECVECPEGMVRSEFDHPDVGCSPCPKGMIPNNDFSGCEACPTGLIPSIGGEECRRCGIGTFQRSSPYFDCKPCPEGLVSLEEGMSQCSKCPVKSYPTNEPDFLGKKCVDCERGDHDVEECENYIPEIFGKIDDVDYPPPLKEESVEEGDDIRRFFCKGSCVTSNVFTTKKTKRQAKLSNCGSIGIETDVVVSYRSDYHVCFEFAKEIFETNLRDYCDENSGKSVVSTGEKSSHCVDQNEGILNPTIVCENF